MKKCQVTASLENRLESSGEKALIWNKGEINCIREAPFVLSRNIKCAFSSKDLRSGDWWTSGVDLWTDEGGETWAA